jgi:RNA polymerase sigma-70 factor (ECF subfamily)
LTEESIELVRRMQGGDREALEELFRRHLPGLRAYVRLHGDGGLRALEESSDLVQSVCREVLGRLDQFRHPGEDGFRRWLFVTAARKIKNRYGYHLAEKRDVGRELPARSAEELFGCYASFCSPSGEAVAREELERIERAFDQLSPRQREVILLSRVMGLAHAEVARAMDRSEGATRALLFRALSRLTELMGQAGPEAG